MVSVFVVSVTILSACSGSIQIGGPPTGAPTCPTPTDPSPERLPGPLVLTAQSVPSAALVPCLRGTLPTGWTFQNLDAQRGKARISIDFHQDGTHAATITLTQECDVRGSRQTDTDQPGTQRYDRVYEVQSGYRGERYYVFRGGCIEYHFNLHGSRSAEQVAAVSLFFRFVDRDLLRRYVHDYSDGRVELDPTAAEGAR
jgi:hypothetical protein